MSKSIGIALRLLILAAMNLMFIGCSSPKLQALNEGDVIVAFGDSLTAGVGAAQPNSYPEVLARLSGVEVINSGVSGETTEEGLARLPQVLNDHSPSLLILLEGGNDILRNNAFSDIERNLAQMIELAHSSGTQVVLIGVPEKRLFSNSAPFYKDLADQYDLVFEPKLIGSLMRSPSKKSDSVHFNKEGYELMAEGIYDLLAKQGAFE